MPATEDAISANFGFLAKRYPELERIAARSERYFADDPIVALITLRQFGEALAQLVAARSGLYTDPYQPQRDLLRRLRLDGRYPSNVLNLFHQLRKDGNAAAHHHTGDHAKALACLKVARQLGIWFYRTFDNHNFKAGPFQPPRPPIEATIELTAEPDRLRAESGAALTARKGRIIRKYALVLALAVAVIYVYAPLGHEDIANLRWLDDINVAINKSLAPAKPDARMFPIDPVAAWNVDEDMDYRIAQHANSLAGWHAFLDSHRDGPHAQAVQAEIERLLPTPPSQSDAYGSGVYAQAPTAFLAEGPSSPAAAPEVSDGASPDAKAPSEVVDPAAAGTEVAPLTPDEICKRDGHRLERLRSSPKSDEAAGFANELGCEKLRPQLAALMESSDHLAPTHPRPSVKVGSAPSQEWREPAHQNRTRWTTLRSVQPSRHSNTRQIVDRRTQYQITMWLECPADETDDRLPRKGCLLLERP